MIHKEIHIDNRKLEASSKQKENIDIIYIPTYVIHCFSLVTIHYMYVCFV